MDGTLRVGGFLLAVASVVLVPSAKPLGAQTAVRLPACGAADPFHAPCQLPFDRPPQLRERVTVPEYPGERRTAQLWLFVDTAGVVQRAQVHRSVGIDWDLTAADLVRQFTFDAARRDGRPTPAWVLFDLSVVPRPQTCADFDMAVPISAGVAVFVDSITYEEREAGRGYRYRMIDDSPADVFIYPRGEQGSPQDEVSKTLEAMQRSFGSSWDSVQVRTRRRQRVRTEYSGSRHEFLGYGATLRVWMHGTVAESYVGVFPAGDSLVKFLVTHPSTRRARGLVDEFTRQILTNRHWRTLGCPR